MTLSDFEQWPLFHTERQRLKLSIPACVKSTEAIEVQPCRGTVYFVTYGRQQALLVAYQSTRNAGVFYVYKTRKESAYTYASIAQYGPVGLSVCLSACVVNWN